MKHFNNTTDDDTYDYKISGKISDIRMRVSRLRNIVTNKDRKKIKKEPNEIEKQKNLSGKKKAEIYDLVKLIKTLNKKEEYKYHDRDDLDYYGIRDIENLFGNVDVDNDNYYKPILTKISFKNNCKHYKSREGKNKKPSVKQYLYKIMPYLHDIINGHKAIRNESKEWKIQITMNVNLFLLKILGKLVLYMYRVIIKKLGWAMKQMALLKSFLNLS